MLTDAVTNRSSPFRIPVFSCGSEDNIESRIVVLIRTTILLSILSSLPHENTGILKGDDLLVTASVNINQIFFFISEKSS